MKTRCLLLAVLAILYGPVARTRQQDKVYTIDLRVFEILPIQTVTWAGPAKNGNIVGTMTGGNVTVNFPAQPVFIQTDLGLSATEEEMKGILYDREYLPRNCVPGGTRWSLAGSYSICCPERDLGMDSARREYYESPIVPSGANLYVGRQEYWLTIFPLSVNEGKTALHLKFGGTVKPSEQDAGGERVLLDKEIEVSLGKIALVGFPQYAKEGQTPTWRGTVYILALLIQLQNP